MAVPIVLTRKEAASALRVSPHTIDRMTADKQLDAVKIRGSVRITTASVEKVARAGTGKKKG